MNTQENNELIAEFMGEQKMVGCYYMPNNGEWTPIKYSHESEMKEHYTLEEMKYNTSWDWLMPVVVKCFDVYDDVHNTNIFNGNNQQFNLNDALLLTDIDSLYKAVVEFIKWYNTQKVSV